jgi:hypothetical protein
VIRLIAKIGLEIGGLARWLYAELRSADGLPSTSIRARPATLPCAESIPTDRGEVCNKAILIHLGVAGFPMVLASRMRDLLAIMSWRLNGNEHGLGVQAAPGRRIWEES